MPWPFSKKDKKGSNDLIPAQKTENVLSFGGSGHQNKESEIVQVPHMETLDNQPKCNNHASFLGVIPANNDRLNSTLSIAKSPDDAKVTSEMSSNSAKQVCDIGVSYEAPDKDCEESVPASAHYLDAGTEKKDVEGVIPTNNDRLNRALSVEKSPDDAKVTSEMSASSAKQVSDIDGIFEVPDKDREESVPESAHSFDAEPPKKDIEGRLKENQFEIMSSDMADDEKESWEEVDGRYVLGEVAGTFKQIPFSAHLSDEYPFHRADIIGDIAKIEKLLLMGASLRGEAHYASKTRRQDSFAIEEFAIDPNHVYAFAIIGDGVGNAKKSDDFSELLTNFLGSAIKEALTKERDIWEADWEYVANYIWEVGVNYCHRKTNSEMLKDYYADWASTLEFVVIDACSSEENKFVHVTIAGDGAAYIICENKDWRVVKHGKQRNSSMLSNEVYALPDKPDRILVKNGVLKKNEMLFLVTDGLGDNLEAYQDVRDFFGDKLLSVKNLPEFIRIISVAVKQMSDDKTGILITHWNDSAVKGEENGR